MKKLYVLLLALMQSTAPLLQLFKKINFYADGCLVNQHFKKKICLALLLIGSFFSTELKSQPSFDSFGDGSFINSNALITTASTYANTLETPAPVGSVTLTGTTLNGIAEVGNASLPFKKVASVNYTTSSTNVTVNVPTYVDGDFMTQTGGTWAINGTGADGGTATWFKRVTGSWIETAERPTDAAGNHTVYITQDLTVLHAGGTYSSGKFFVTNNAKLTYSTTNFILINNIVIDSGATIDMVGIINLSATGEFEIRDAGNFIFSASTSGASQTTSIWNGIEKFYPTSNFIIKNHTVGTYFLPPAENLTANTFNGISAYFGNLILDATARMAVSNLSSTTNYLTHNDLEIRSIPSGNFFWGNGTWIVGKDLKINSGISNNFTVAGGGINSYSVNLNVKGNFINNSTPNFRLINNANPSCSVFLNIDGDIILTNTGGLNLNVIAGGSATVNLKGDLQVASGAIFLANSNAKASFNFSGTGDGTTAALTQTIDVANSTTASNISFTAISGSYVKLTNQDLALGTNSKFTVNAGAVLDFGFTGTNALHLTSVSGQTGQFFDAKDGSTLKITSPLGITTGGTFTNGGNVQIGTTGARLFGTGAIYHYIGKANQVPGNGLPLATSAKKLIVELNDDTLTFQPIGTINFNASGELEIRKGIVYENATGSFADVGKLTMTGGRYRLFNTGSNPGLSATYALSGGVVEFANSQPTLQTIRAITYHDIEVSGTNVKSDLTTPLHVKGNLNILNWNLDLNGQKLTIGGSLTGTGGSINAQHTNSTIEMAGTTAQTLSGAMFINRTLANLVNNNAAGISLSATANDTLKITGSVSFGNRNNSIITTNDNLTLVSTEAATAGIADLTNNGANSGNSIVGKVTVERFISYGSKWRLLAIPTNSTQTFKQAWQEDGAAMSNLVAGYGVIIGNNRSTWAANGFDMLTPGGPTVKVYDAVTNNYLGINSTNNNIKTNGGYLVYIRGNRSNTVSTTTIRTTGELYTGAQPSITVPANEFKIIGNPYASKIDLTKLSTSGLQDVFYVWDPKAASAGSYSVGAYQQLIKMGDGFVIFPGGGSYGDQLSVVNTIESGQAFFVKGGSQIGSIQFRESVKQLGSSLVSRNPSANSPMLRATLYIDTTIIDAAMVNFDEAYNNGVDENDILKMINNNENVSININNVLLVADRRKAALNNDTTLLNLTGVRVQTYKWVINADLLAAAGRIAFLRDAYTNTNTPLNLNGVTEYNFSVENIPASYASNRFSIVYQQSAVLPVSITTVSAVRSAIKSNEVMVSWKVEEEMNMENYMVEMSTDGSSFSSIATVGINNSNNGSGTYSLLNDKAAAADHFYRIRANSIGGQVQYSAVVKVAGAKTNGNSSISVYPNPIVDKKMNVQFNNQAAGSYGVKLINNNGVTVYQKNVSVNSNNLVRTMSLQNNTAAGTYQLIITDDSGKTQTQAVIIL